jgi:hypothetical protein
MTSEEVSGCETLNVCGWTTGWRRRDRVWEHTQDRPCCIADAVEDYAQTSVRNYIDASISYWRR